MSTKEITEIGKKLKIALIRQNKSQKWFIGYLKERLPDMYIDSSIIHKIMVGEVSSGKIYDEISSFIYLVGNDERTTHTYKVKIRRMRRNTQ